MGYAERRFEEGVAVGEQRGISIGEQRTRQMVTTRLLRQRFPTQLTPEHEAALTSASVAELDLLIDKIFVLSHPDELFALLQPAER